MTEQTAHALDNFAETNEGSQDFLTVMITGQQFGIPILQIQDVLGQQAVTRIPLAPREVAGSLNLRGRIVTAIDVKKRLGIEEDTDSEAHGTNMSVVVEHENQLYSLIIDSVGDVIRLRNEDFENNPPTLDSSWRDISSGIFRLDKELLIILDVPNLLESVHN